jgi:uncharacterized membrane protein YdbT with pleckstrin-like domain
MICSRFGIKKMKGEHVIFAARPDGFIRYGMISTAMSVVGIPFLPLVWLVARIAQDKYRYWLTNKRIILSSGFIGFNVRSIPLERISDVCLTRSFPEMVAGVSSLSIRDMTGESQMGQGLIAIADVSEFQKQILDEVQRVNSAQDL